MRLFWKITFWLNLAFLSALIAFLLIGGFFWIAGWSSPPTIFEPILDAVEIILTGGVVVANYGLAYVRHIWSKILWKCFFVFLVVETAVIHGGTFDFGIVDVSLVLSILWLLLSFVIVGVYSFSGTDTRV